MDPQRRLAMVLFAEALRANVSPAQAEAILKWVDIQKVPTSTLITLQDSPADLDLFLSNIQSPSWLSRSVSDEVDYQKLARSSSPEHFPQAVLPTRFLEHYPRATSEQTPYFAARHDPLTSFPSSKSTGELLSSRSTGDRPRTPPTSSSPDRQPSKPCLYFARGHCKHGDDCKFLHVAPRLKNPPGGAAGENPPPATTPEVLEVEVVDLVSSHNGPVTTSSLPQLYFEKYKKTLRADGYLTGTESRGKTGFSLTKLLKSFRALALIERPHGQHAVVLVEDAPYYSRALRAPDLFGAARQIFLTFHPSSNLRKEDVEAYFLRAFGAVQSVRIPDDYPRQYGFVTFYDASIAQKVLMDRDRDTPHDIGGTEVRVKEYDSSASRPKGEKKAKGDALAPAVAIPGSPPPGLVPARYDDRDGSSMFLALQQGEDRQLYRRQLEDEDAAAHRIHAALAASMQQMSLVAAAPGSGSGSGSGAGSPRLLGGSSVAADLYSAAAGGPQQQQQQDARDVWAASLYPPAQQVAARQQDSRGGGGGGGGGMYAPPSGLLPGGAYLHQHQQDADLELYGPPGVGGFRSHPDEVQARGMYPGSSALEQMYSLTERSGQLGQQQQQELAQVSHMYGAAAAAPPPSGASGKGKAANKSKQLLLQQQQVQHQQQHPMFYPATHVGAAGLSSKYALRPAPPQQPQLQPQPQQQLYMQQQQQQQKKKGGSPKGPGELAHALSHSQSQSQQHPLHQLQLQQQQHEDARAAKSLFLHGQQAAAAATQQRQQQQQQHSEQQPHPAFPHSHSLPHARRRSFAASPSPPPQPERDPLAPPLGTGGAGAGSLHQHRHHHRQQSPYLIRGGGAAVGADQLPYFLGRSLPDEEGGYLQRGSGTGWSNEGDSRPLWPRQGSLPSGSGPLPSYAMLPRVHSSDLTTLGMMQSIWS